MGVITTNKIQQRIDRMVFVSAFFSLLCIEGQKDLVNIINLEQATIFTAGLYLIQVEIYSIRPVARTSNIGSCLNTAIFAPFQ